jgi:hypothetical protein
VPTPNTIESKWRAGKVFLGQYNRGEDYEYHLAQYMFTARCKAQNVSPFLQFLHLVANTDWDMCDVPSSSARSNSSSHLLLQVSVFLASRAQTTVLCYFVTFNDTLFHDVTPQHTHGYISYIRECLGAAILGPGFYITFTIFCY